MVSNNASDSATPDVMYGWRVEAFETWIASQKKSEAITMEHLSQNAGHLEQYHYLGLDANNDVITVLTGEDGDKIAEEVFVVGGGGSGSEKSSNSIMSFLDIGSGIGGPGRYIAWLTGAKVLGFDIQADLVEMANKVSKEVNLQEKARFITADVGVEENVILKNSSGLAFDGFYSILVFLHIPKQPRLRAYKNISAALKPGARYVIEDYWIKDDAPPMDDEEKHLLFSVIGAVYVPTESEYLKELSMFDLGSEAHFEDLSGVWRKWCDIRYERFKQTRDKQVQLYGEGKVRDMETFYSAPARLFGSGKLGGGRITGIKGSDGAGLKLLKRGRDIVLRKRTNEMSLMKVAEILDKQKTVENVAKT